MWEIYEKSSLFQKKNSFNICATYKLSEPFLGIFYDENLYWFYPHKTLH